MVKQLSHHIRLLSAALAGVALFFLLPEHWRVVTRVLVSWDFGVFLFLSLAFRHMTKLDPTQLRDRYAEEDETAPVILAISILAALLSLISIVVFFSGLDDLSLRGNLLHVGFAVSTVITSWLLIPTLFTLHYADYYYSSDSAHRPLRFPDTDAPLFWDFAYFSFTIAAACQTADVCTAQGSIRKAVLVHSVLSFFFNASVLGFVINVTAGLIGKH